MSWIEFSKVKSKKIIFNFILILLTLLLTSFVLFFVELTLLERVISSRKKMLLPKEFYSFYEAESWYVNHLRDLDINRYNEGLYKFPTDLMYTEVGEGKFNILIQGDSWGDQFAFNKLSKDKIASLALEKDIRFTLSGVSSYSPSLYTAQLNRLRFQYGIHPDIVVTLIDQTDVGDELCRYYYQRVYGSNGLEVRPFGESLRSETYNNWVSDEINRILRSNYYNLTKVILLAKNKIDREMEKNFNPPKCGWSSISRPLFDGLTNDEKIYLKKILNEYINTVFSERKVKFLYLVTFPHSNNLNGNYKLDVRELVVDVFENSPYKNRIIEFRPPTDFIKGNNQLLYRLNDAASHLTDLAHAEYLVGPLLGEISSVID